MPWTVFFALALGLVMLKHSMLMVAKGHRAVIYRMGRYLGLKGPGLHFIIPFIDRYDGIDLDTVLPDWRLRSREEVDRAVIESVRKALL